MALEITPDEALDITSETLLKLVQKGVYKMVLTTDNDAHIIVTMVPAKEDSEIE